MKYKYFRGVICSLIVVSVSLTLLQGYFLIFTRLWLTTTIGAIVTLLLFHNKFNKNIFALLLIYFSFIVIKYFLGNTLYSDIGNVVLEISSLSLVFFMYYGLVKEKNIKTHSFVIYSYFCVLIITAIGSLWCDSISPGAIRMAFGANVLGDDKNILHDFYKMGMSNYSLPHAVPVLIPGVVFGLKRRVTLSKSIRFFIYLTLASLILLVYLSGSTTALLLSILSLVICLFIAPNNNQKNVSRLLVLLLILSPLLLSKNIQLSLLKSFDNFVGDGSYFHAKVVLFQESIEYNNTNAMEKRDYHYELSLNELLDHPIWGSEGQLGGHSSILDRVAALGILGFSPFFLFLINQFKSTFKVIHKEDQWFYFVGFMMGILTCCLKGMWNWDMHFSMFVFLPISIIFFRNLSVEKK